nr:nucleocapsid [Orthobunyavirus brazoriaense]
MSLSVTQGFDFADDQPGDPQFVFDPRQAYQVFISTYGQGLQDLSAVRIFLSKARQCKLKMREKRIPQINTRFGALVLPLVNCHHPDFRQNRIPGTALTLRRVSGFIAMYIMFQYEVSPANRAIIERTIVNPIARAKNLDWDIGYKLYLSFLPGAEFYLLELDFFPLCIAMYRVKDGKLDEDFLDRIMAQQVEGMNQDLWTVKYEGLIEKSEKIVNNLQWKDKPAGRITQAGLEFLRKRGIAMRKYGPSAPLSIQGATALPMLTGTQNQQQQLQNQQSATPAAYTFPGMQYFQPQMYQSIPQANMYQPQIQLQQPMINQQQYASLGAKPKVNSQLMTPISFGAPQVAPRQQGLPFLNATGPNLQSVIPPQQKLQTAPLPQLTVTQEESDAGASAGSLDDMTEEQLTFGDFSAGEDRLAYYEKLGYTPEQIKEAEAKYLAEQQQ